MLLHTTDDQAHFHGREVAHTQPDNGSLSNAREEIASEYIHDGQERIHTPYRAESMFLPQNPAAPTDPSQDFILIDNKRDTDALGSSARSVVVDMKDVRRAYRPIHKTEALRRIREAGEAQGGSCVQHPHLSDDSRHHIEKWLLGVCVRERREKQKTRKLRKTGNTGAAVPVKRGRGGG